MKNVFSKKRVAFLKILYVDDEISAHINFKFATRNRDDINSLEFCFDYQSAVNFAKQNEIDCAFLDIEIADKNGIELANELLAIHPNLELAFITSHEDFSREAYKVGGRAYISKPYEQQELDSALNLFHKIIKQNETEYEAKPEHIYAKTFGNFDLLVDGLSFYFKNSKAKELLAFLVHHMGGTVTGTQIFYALWEKQEYSKATSTYVRRTIRALKEELKEQNIDDIIICNRNNFCVDLNKLAIDCNDLLQGDALTLKKYNGEYMNQYYWGESAIPLFNRIAKYEYN